MGIDEFAVIGPLLLDKKFGNLTARGQASCQFSGVGDDGARLWSQFPLLSAGIIDGKGKFTANSDEAARNVRSWDGAQVPRIK